MIHDNDDPFGSDVFSWQPPPSSAPPASSVRTTTTTPIKKPTVPLPMATPAAPKPAPPKAAPTPAPAASAPAARRPKTAAEVCQHFTPGDEARRLIDDMPPRLYLEALIERELYPDAVRFLAYWMPKREAVCWAYLCARRVAGANPPTAIAAALQATAVWVTEPTEDHRRAAGDASERAGVGTPAGGATLAAFLSGGSLGPANVEAIPPGEFLTAKTVAGAVLLAAVVTEPEKAPEKFRTFLDEGTRVLENGQRLIENGLPPV